MPNSSALARFTASGPGDKLFYCKEFPNWNHFACAYKIPSISEINQSDGHERRPIFPSPKEIPETAPVFL
jgi:hypothetical protein